MSLVGLDVGTTGCKAVAFDLEGCILASAYREYPLLHPRPGWAEINASLLWERVREVLSAVAAGTCADPVQAIAVSCQGESVSAIDQSRRHLHNFIVTFDNRTIPQSQWWDEHVGREEIFQRSGMPLHPMYALNKIMWIKEQRPDIYERTWKFVLVEDAMLTHLGAEPSIDYSLAARTMALDVRHNRWSASMLEQAGVDEALLSSLVSSGSVVGRIDRRVASELGLPSDTLLVTGGHDQTCGALGAGVLREGMAMHATGTSDVICPSFDRLLLTEAMLASNFPVYPHVSPGRYVTIGVNMTGGLLLRWYRDVLCAEERLEAERSGRDVYDVIVERAREEPADVFILPHFVGSGTPAFDPRSRGAIVGLRLDTTKAELNRAVLDSTAYEMRLNLQCLAEAGVRITELRAIGGGSKSRRWLQFKADTFGIPVVSLSVSEAASLGAAMLAGVAAGVYASCEEAVDTVVRPNETFEPHASEHEQLCARYERYRDLYPALRPFYQHWA